MVDEKLVLLPSFQDGPWNGWYTRGTASLIYRGTELTIFPEFRFPSPATSLLHPLRSQNDLWWLALGFSRPSRMKISRRRIDSKCVKLKEKKKKIAILKLSYNIRC